MGELSDSAGRFGYAAFAYTAHFTSREWAWEFLRHNDKFGADYGPAVANFSLNQVSESRRTVVEREQRPHLERWGIKYADAPTIHAGAASVFWTPEASAAVLRMYALCECKDMDTPLFNLGEIACKVTILLTAGMQHLLFQEEGRSLQVQVSGYPMDNPVYLFSEAVLEPREAPARLRTLRCFNDLLQTGHLLKRNFPSEPQGTRLCELLQAWELSRIVSSHRSIATALYGETRVETDWTDPHSGMQDHVRRTLKRAQKLVAQGYRSLLA